MKTSMLLASLLVLAVTLTSVTARAVGQGAEELRQRRDNFDALGFLQQYGYLPVSRDNEFVFHSESTITRAVKDFQAFTGLPVTGVLDEISMNKMKTPRCGFPDIRSNYSSFTAGSTHPRNFATLGVRWNHQALTWKPIQLSSKLPESDQRRALERGLKYWSDVTPLSFQPTSGQADIEIQFVRGDHGDGYYNRFDGRGAVLAHAFQPGVGMGGDAHFDEDEDWTLGTGEGTDLEIVAAHEFGHSLGLDHSNVYGALMAPYYSYTRDFKLHADDIQGIQSLYGSRKPIAPTTPSTKTTATTQSTTTSSTTTVKSTLPIYCTSDFTLDAVAAGEQGTSFLFRHDQVYKVGPRGLESGYPKLITEVFPDGPVVHISAAVYLPAFRRHYLFKDSRVWRYSNFQLDADYPKEWLSQENYVRFRPNAAVTFTYSSSTTQIFMFGEDTFWEWDPRTETLPAGYPLPTATYWIGAPHHPQAAMTNGDTFYFFKDNRYYKLRNRVLEGQPEPIANYWFGNACRSNSSV